MKRWRTTVKAVPLLALPISLLGAATVSADAPTPSGDVTLTAIGTYDGGGLGNAEIVAFDPTTDRMVIANGADIAVDIVSIADPTAPVLVTSFDLSAYGDGVNGVSVYADLVAAAVEVDPAFDPTTGIATPENGKVVFFDTSGSYVADVEVGVQPDAVAFTPDGSQLVVSGEGEPICAENVGNAEDADVAKAVDPAGTVAVIPTPSGVPGTATILDFSGFDTATLRSDGVRIFFPGSTAAEDLEPEYAVISDDSTTAFITLQEANAVAVVDLTVPEISAIVPLGTKDFSTLALDPSNRDSGIELGTWDVQGLYMPDAIDQYSVGGSTYLVTANEGDSRDYSCYSEEERLADLDYTGSTLDAELLTAVADDALLGRLKTTSAAPTADPIDTLYMYGARSFTIWDTSGTVVWDSGSDFAEYVAAAYPAYFNTQADDGAAPGAAMVATMLDEFDSRSDDKGSEPEAVVVGRIGERHYAFVGLERQGGIMVYDVTDPTSPAFEDYVNVALDELVADGPFTDPGTTDVSPEGVWFVAPSESPTGLPLLLVANELSGTTTIYQVSGSEIDDQLSPAPTTTVAAPSTTDPTVSPTLPSTGTSTVSVLAATAVVLVLSGFGMRVARRR